MGKESKENSKKKKGPKKKKSQIFAEHKPVFVGGIIAAVAIAGIVGGIYWYIESIKDTKKDGLVTDYSSFWYNDTLMTNDPFWGWGAVGSTRYVISQIAEGLFEYDITSETTKIVPNLALNGTWSFDVLNFTCELRQNVTFHDGTPFNATAVKWNFDRLHNLLGNLSYPYIWYHADGKLILNRTEIVDDYTVKFVLNRQFIPFKAMLCSLQSFILSPSTASLNDFIWVDTELIGTGPFKYEYSTWLKDPTYLIYYTENTTLVANPDYWGGPPEIKKLVFKYYEQPDEHEKRFYDMIEGKLDLTYLWPWKENYTDYPEITLHYHNSSVINCVWMKNDLINATMRKAISYAFNYSKMLAYEETRWEGGVIKCKSPLSKGILYSNWVDFDVPYYNLTYARQILQEVNWNATAGGLIANDNITAGNEWESLVTDGTPLAIYNHSYNVAWDLDVFYKDLIVENLKQIGIEINLVPFLPGEGWKRAWSHFYQSGWYPDYNDPSNNINPLFSNKADGHSNWGNVNDTEVQQLMENGLNEIDNEARRQLYYDIQQLLIEEVYPCIWTYTEAYCNVHGPNLGGINYYLWPYKSLYKTAHY
jgi:ABC-type transport system substrate-binding protein